MRRAATLAILVTFMGAVVDGLHERERDAEWIAPADAAGKVNPLAGRSDVVPGGQKVYQQRCASCHGDDGGGSPKAPNLLQGAVQTQQDGELYWKISSGNTRQGMPSFSFLPELQRWQLVETLRAKAQRP